MSENNDISKQMSGLNMDSSSKYTPPHLRGKVTSAPAIPAEFLSEK
jgi:hypothetical protein